MSLLDIVAFDADDTLWHNLVHFDAAENRFGDILAEHVESTDAIAALMAAEKRNIPLYGFGVKGFTLSMIETAIALSEGAVDSTTIAKLVDLGRAMLDHDIELLPHVGETLARLHGHFRLLLVTKGDLHHQERKVLASGLAHFFDGVEVVSDKTPETYRTIAKRHGAATERTLMAGNSLKSDVLPMIRAGGYGVHVPFAINWDFEHEDVPEGTPRIFVVDDLRGVEAVARKLAGS